MLFRFLTVTAVAATLVSGARAGTITETDLATLTTALGSAASVDTFGPDFAFPIATGVLDSTTNMVTSQGGPILPGLIAAGVTYSTPIASGNFFNIDFGGQYSGGFLDGLAPGGRLTISFATAQSAFGFLADPSTTGSSVNVKLTFTDTTSYSVTESIGALQGFGFMSSAADIASVEIYGNNTTPYAFAVDDVTFGTIDTPEPASMVLLGAGLAGLGLARRRRG
jgi:hypothetical protein